MGKKVLSVETVFPTAGTAKRTKVILSHEKFKDTIELAELDESWLSKPVFPPLQTLALFAHLAYEDDPHPINRDWQLLTTATNEADNYFGAAFWNSTEQQLVVSHRGTNNIKAVLTDIEGVISNRHTSQIDSACTFVAHALREISDLKGRFGQIQISITGHSLGAWLAQITAFSSEYLTIDRDTNKFRLRNENDVAYHAHCVGFESPGCREMLSKLSEMYHPRYQYPDYNLWTNLDITLHFTRPNMINTFRKHVGKLAQIDVRPLDRQDDNLIQYTLHYHSRKNIVSALSAGEAEVIKEIHDWPLLTFPENSKNDGGTNPSKFNLFAVGKILKSVPSLLYQYLRSDRQEVEEFKKHANSENNYSPEFNDDLKCGVKVHYEVHKVDERICHLNIFSEVEQFFLFYWQNFNALNLGNKNVIKEEMVNALLLVNSKLKLDEFFQVPFTDLSHDENYCLKMGFKRMKFAGECNVEKLISFIKQLFRLLDNNNNSKEFVRSFARNTEANVLIVKKFSTAFLRGINVNCLTFIDNIGLKKFLNFKDEETKEKNIFLIRSKFKFEIQRVENILSSEAKQKFIYLDLKQIVYLNSCLNLSKTFASMAPDYAIVLACQQQNFDKKDIEILSILLENIMPTSIIIIIVARSELFLERKYNLDFKLLEVDDANLNLSDLTADSKITFVNFLIDKEIILQGKRVKLLHFISDEKIDTLDSNIVTELLNDDKVLEIGSEPMKLCQTESSYAKRLKFIKIEYLLEAFLNTKDFNARNKSEVFVITSFDEISAKRLIQLLRIKNENAKQKINELTDVIFKAENENIECAKINILKMGDETHFKKFCYNNSDKIVYWLEIINEQFYLLQIFDTDFYIKRNLFHHKCVKKEAVLDLFTSERFVLTHVNNIDEILTIQGQIYEKIQQRKFKLESESEKAELDNIFKRNIFASINENEALNQFNEWCAESKTTPVHWLVVSDGLLVWKQSHFSLNELRKYLNIREIDEQKVANLNDKVVVLVAEPGMGKSTTLTRLSEYKLDDNWVIRLNLKDYKSEILSLPNDYIETESVVKFLLRVSRADINCQLAAELLKFSLIRGTLYPVLILFDGYDEIDRDQQSKLIPLLKYLKEKTLANLWITSRKHFTGDLENKLRVFSTTFKELNLAEREIFLKTYWQVRLKLELSETEFRSTFDYNNETNKFKQFFKALIEKVDKVLNEKMSSFMGIPLQMRLLAEGFLPQFEAFIKSESESEVPYFDELNVAQIYEKFIKVKFDIYFQEKTRLSFGLNQVSAAWFSNDVLKIHQKLALQLLFPVESKHLLEKDFNIKPNEEIELKRIGLLHSPQHCGELEFVHRTFAEYFAATFILNRLRKTIHPKQFDAVENLLKLIFQKFDVICSFLNELILETDLSSVKTDRCFGKNIFDYLDKAVKNNHVNLINFISSFFKNKFSHLNRCKFYSFLRISLNAKNADIAESFLTLTANHYNVLRKSVLHPSFEIIDSRRYKLWNNSGAIYCRLDACKKQNVKRVMNAIKSHTRIFEELIEDYYLEDLLEIFRDDEDLCQLMRRLKRDISARENEINRILNSIRDKYKGNIGNEIYKLKSLIEGSSRDKTTRSGGGPMNFLDEFLHLISEDKPRELIQDFPALSRTFNYVKMLGVVVDRLRNSRFRIAALWEENDENLFEFLQQIKKNCELVDFVKLLKGETEIQFLQHLINDEDFSELLNLLKNFTKNYYKKPKKIVEPCRPIDDSDDPIRAIGCCVDTPKVFPCYEYYVHHLKPQSHKAINFDDEIKFIFHGFKSEIQPCISPAFSSIFESFLNEVECEETKNLLSHFLPILAMVEYILIDVDILNLIKILLKQMKPETIKSWREVLILVNKHSKIAPSNFVVYDEAESIKIDVNVLLDSLHLLFIHSDESFYEVIGKQETVYLERILRFITAFPGIFYIFIFKIFNSNFQIYNHFSQEKVCLIFEILFQHFPHVARCLSISVSPHQNTHITYAVKCNYTKVISLLFKNLRPFPRVLRHLIIGIPQYKHKSCLHYVIVESELKMLGYFLAELNRNVDIMKFVVEHFASDEEDKLNLYEAAEIKNAGAILVFLDSLKDNEELFKSFVFPADVSVKSAFYLAGERGCKEVMDTLLSALKSEPDTLWELLVWAEPNSGQTVLHRACDRGYTEIVEALLNSIRKQAIRLKSLFSLQDNLGHTALDRAILSGRQIIIKNCFDYSSQNELLHNIDYKNLREHFTNFNFITQQIKSLRALSSTFKYFPKVVNLLLIMAKSFNNVELMLAIFENADLSSALESVHVTLDTYSYQLFDCAIERNSPELVERLIAKGMDVNATNGYGLTPLTRAVYKNRLEIKKMLISSGADIILETRTTNVLF